MQSGATTVTTGNYESVSTFSWAAVEQGPLVLSEFIGLLYQHWIIDGGDCGVIDIMNDWQGKRSTRRIPAPVPL
jgi:hypothetical protein